MTDDERAERYKSRLRNRLNPTPIGEPVAFDYYAPDDYIPLFPWEWRAEAPALGELKAIEDFLK